MFLTGFADEASKNIEGQIKATKILGWSNIEARNINDTNIIDLPQDDFEQLVSSLDIIKQLKEFGKVIVFGLISLNQMERWFI